MIFTFLSKIWLILDFFSKMQKSEGVPKFFPVFSWGTKFFCVNFVGYEIFFGILEFHSAPVPGIRNDRSLICSMKLLFELCNNHERNASQKKVTPNELMISHLHNTIDWWGRAQGVALSFFIYCRFSVTFSPITVLPFYQHFLVSFPNFRNFRDNLNVISTTSSINAF